MNKSAKKKKRKLLASDEAIASAITHFSNGVLKVKKMKLKVIEKLIDSERKGCEFLMKEHLQIAALFVKILKNKDSSGSSK